MELIFLDHTRFELGVLSEYALDIDLADQKDFEIKTLTDNRDLLQEKYWWYIDGTEYGGIIDKISHDTESDEIVYTGRNFRGILATRVVEPQNGEDYVVVDGNAQDVLNMLIAQVGLSDLFVANESDIEINQYQFDRYTDLYSGIIKMLDSVNCKLKLRYSALDSKCHIWAELIDDYSDYLTYCKDTESQEVTLEDFEADIGDVVGGIDDVTGIELCEKITNMIVTIQNDVINIDYSIGGENK